MGDSPDKTGEVGYSFAERKRSLELASGKWEQQLSATLGKLDFNVGSLDVFRNNSVLKHFQWKMNMGMLEAKLKKGEFDLNVMKVELGGVGELPELIGAWPQALQPLFTVKVAIKISVPISAEDLVRLRAMWRARQAAKAAQVVVTKQAAKLGALKAQGARLATKLKAATNRTMAKALGLQIAENRAAQKKALAVLGKSQKALMAAKHTFEAARFGLRTGVAKLAGTALAKSAAKVFAKALPIVGWAAWLQDAYTLGKWMYHWKRGQKRNKGGGAGNGKGQGGVGSRAGNGGAGDVDAQLGAAAGTGDGGAGGGNVDVGASGAATNGAQVADAEPTVELHAGGKAILAVLHREGAGQTLQSSDFEVLNDAWPRAVTAAELEAVRQQCLQARGAAGGDVFALAAWVREAIEGVRAQQKAGAHGKVGAHGEVGAGHGHAGDADIGAAAGARADTGGLGGSLGGGVPRMDAGAQGATAAGTTHATGPQGDVSVRTPATADAGHAEPSGAAASTGAHAAQPGAPRVKAQWWGDARLALSDQRGIAVSKTLMRQWLQVSADGLQIEKSAALKTWLATQPHVGPIQVIDVTPTGTPRGDGTFDMQVEVTVQHGKEKEQTINVPPFMYTPQATDERARLTKNTPVDMTAFRTAMSWRGDLATLAVGARVVVNGVEVEVERAGQDVLASSENLAVFWATLRVIKMSPQATMHRWGGTVLETGTRLTVTLTVPR